jgi:PAS domain-containing protein
MATEVAALGVFVWHIAEDTASWENQRMYEIFGRTREDGPIEGVRFMNDAVHPDSLDAFHCAVEATVQRREPFYFEGIVRKKDGTPCAFLPSRNSEPPLAEYSIRRIRCEPVAYSPAGPPPSQEPQQFCNLLPPLSLPFYFANVVSYTLLRVALSIPRPIMPLHCYELILMSTVVPSTLLNVDVHFA